MQQLRRTWSGTGTIVVRSRLALRGQRRIWVLPVLGLLLALGLMEVLLDAGKAYAWAPELLLLLLVYAWQFVVGLVGLACAGAVLQLADTGGIRLLPALSLVGRRLPQLLCLPFCWWWVLYDAYAWPIGYPPDKVRKWLLHPLLAAGTHSPAAALRASARLMRTRWGRRVTQRGTVERLAIGLMLALTPLGLLLLAWTGTVLAPILGLLAIWLFAAPLVQVSRLAQLRYCEDKCLLFGFTVEELRLTRVRLLRWR